MALQFHDCCSKMSQQKLQNGDTVKYLRMDLCKANPGVWPGLGYLVGLASSGSLVLV